MIDLRPTSLAMYSSLRIGGEGLVVEVTKLAELIEAVMYARKEGLRVHIIGEGTNSFFGENLKEFLFVVMKSKGVGLEDIGDTVLVTAQGGELFDDVVQFTVSQNLWGLENLSYIPGTVGAAPVQNIGAYGVELKDVLVSVSALDMKTLNVVEVSCEACHFGYRDSLFKRNGGRYCIVAVTLRLSKTSQPALTYKPLDTLLEKEDLTPRDVRELVVITRKSKLPDYHEYPNTGSFFKNPVVTEEQGKALSEQYPTIPLIEVVEGYKIPAAWLIEHIAEAKGERMGNVGTWPQQPLVIVNYGQATTSDLLTFSGSIIDRIKEKTGIEMEREVNFVG